MPRRKTKRKRGRRGKRLGRAAGIRATGSLPAVSLGDSDKLHNVFRSVETMKVLLDKERQWKEAKVLDRAELSIATATNPLGKYGSDDKSDEKAKRKDEVKIAWSDIEDSDSDDSPFITSPVVELRALRSIFKADTPYRTRLGEVGTLTTSAAGVLNATFMVNSISSASEWSAIDQLFDEVFIHSMTLRYQPVNVAGGGIGTEATFNGASIPTRTTTSTIQQNAGLCVVSLFNGAASYSTMVAMLANPTRMQPHSSKPFVYVWRNNTRFDPRGVVAQNTAWQGWTLVSGVTNYGGSVQVRTANDVTLGSTSTAFTAGTISFVFDVSFRARA